MKRFGESGVETTSGTMAVSPLLDDSLDVIQIGLELIGAQRRLAGRQAKPSTRRVPLGFGSPRGGGIILGAQASRPEVKERPDRRLGLARLDEGLKAPQVIGAASRGEQRLGRGCGNAVVNARQRRDPPRDIL